MFTKELFQQHYYNLSHSTSEEERRKGNQYVIDFKNSQEAWGVCRELIFTCQNDIILQSQACHILNQKIREQFQSLSQIQKEEIKTFIFVEILNNNNKILTKISQKLLCSAASAIGILEISNNWSTLIQDIIKFMENSKENLLLGLEILEYIASDISEITMDRPIFRKIKQQFLQKESDLFNIFNSLLKIEIDGNQEIIQKCLLCVKAWSDVNMKLQIFRNEFLVAHLINILKQNFFHTEIFNIFQEGFSNSDFADMLKTGNFQLQIQKISEIESQNIRKIIEILFIKNQEMEQKDLMFCKVFTELVIKIGCKFPFIILQKNDYAFQILGMILKCSSHYNKKISFITFEFWNEYKKNIQDFFGENFNVQENIFLIEPYLELLKIIIHQCCQKNMKIKSNHLSLITKKQSKMFNEENSNTDDDEDDHLDLNDNSTDIKNMTVSDYRNYAQDVVSEIYLGLQTFLKDHGEKQFFEIVFSCLQTNNNNNNTTTINNINNISNNNNINNISNNNNNQQSQQNVNQNNNNNEEQQQQQMLISQKQEYLVRVEVCLFIFRSVMDLIIISNKSNQYLRYMYEFILKNEQLPQELLIQKSSIQLLYDGCKELTFCDELFDLTIRYLVNYIQHPQLGKLCATCLKEIIESLSKINQLETFKFLTDQFVQTFWSLQDNEILDLFIQSVFGYALRLENVSVQEEAIKTLFILIGQKLNQFIQLITTSQIQIHDFCKMQNLLIGVMNSFNSIDQRLPSISVISSNFIQQNITYLNQLFLEFGCYNHEIMMKFLNLFKLIIQVCGEQLPSEFVSILETSLKILIQNPVKNAQALSIFPVILESLEQNNQVFINWMNNNFTGFNKYMLDIFQNPENSDPDLIKFYVQVLNRTVQFKENILLECGYFDLIIQFVINSFVKINEYGMTRSIFYFFASFISKSKKSMQVSKYLDIIIKILLVKLPDINKSFLHNTALIFVHIFNIFNDEAPEIQKKILNVLQDSKFSILSNDHKIILANALHLYAIDENPKDLKILLSDFTNVLIGTFTINDFYLPLEIKMKAQERQQKKNKQKI